MNNETNYIDERKRQRDKRLNNKKPSKYDYEDALYNNHTTNNHKKKKGK